MEQGLTVTDVDAPPAFLHHRIPMPLDMGPLAITAHQRGARFSVRAKPRASRSAVKGVREDALLVDIAAPPVEGEANEELLRLLSRTLGVPRRSVDVIVGEHGRTKVIEVQGLSADDVRARLGGAA